MFRTKGLSGPFSQNGVITQGNFFGIGGAGSNRIIDSNPAANEVMEGLPSGEDTGIQGYHEEASTYTLSNDAGGLFSINGANGVVTTTGPLTYAIAMSHTIEISADIPDVVAKGPFTNNVLPDLGSIQSRTRGFTVGFR